MKKPLPLAVLECSSQWDFPRAFSLAAEQSRAEDWFSKWLPPEGTTSSGESSPHRLLLDLKSEFAKYRGLHLNVLHIVGAQVQWLGELTYASSGGICLPLLTGKVCSHALLSAVLEMKTVSEQAVARMPQTDRNRSAWGEFTEVRRTSGEGERGLKAARITGFLFQGHGQMTDSLDLLIRLENEQGFQHSKFLSGANIINE